MPATTYIGHNMAKMAGSHFIAGSGDIASAYSAQEKFGALQAILQRYYHDPDYVYDDSPIGETDVKKAIAYAMGKKAAKAMRRLGTGSAKFVVHSGLTIAGAAGGSVVPVAGTALGAVAGYAAGAAVSSSVTIADQLARKAKWLYKKAHGTQGVHRAQAAACLYGCASGATRGTDSTDHRAARAALEVLLQGEYDALMKSGDLERIAARLKSV